MTKQTKLSDFLKGVEEEDEKHRTPNAEIEERETLKAEFDTVYENYIVESYTSDIPSNFDGKTNTIVRMTSPAGDKVQMWVGSYEQEHFQQKITKYVLFGPQNNLLLNNWNQNQINMKTYVLVITIILDGR